MGELVIEDGSDNSSTIQCINIYTQTHRCTHTHTYTYNTHIHKHNIATHTTHMHIYNTYIHTHTHTHTTHTHIHTHNTLKYCILTMCYWLQPMNSSYDPEKL